MRTFEEINADIGAAINKRDATALRRFADEMFAMGTAHAQATAQRAMGIADYLTAEYPLSLEHFRRALAIHEELGERRGVATVIGNMGNVYKDMGDFPSALEHHRRALAMHDALGNRQGVASVTGNMGNVYRVTGDYPTALEHYHRALEMHQDLGDPNGVALITGNLGIVYESTGDYPQALDHFRRAFVLHEELGDRNGVARCIANMGIVYDQTGDYPTALEHYRRALAMHMELGERSGVARVTGNIGAVYEQTGDYPTALEHYRRALSMHEELGERSDVALVTGNMIAALLSMNRDEEARDLLQRQPSMVMDNPAARAVYHANHARLAEHMDDLVASHDHLITALGIASEAGMRAETGEYHKRLRDLALKRNDLPGYVEHNNEYTRITEEIRGKEATIKLAMQAKEREIAERDKEHQKQLAVLHSTLPKHIADRVARGEVVNDHYDNAAVLFLDIVGFTTISDRIPPGHVVHLLDQIFSSLDTLCEKHSVTKIKTIGDSYMAVAFEGDTAERMAQCARDMMASLDTLVITMPPSLGDTSWTKDVGDIRVRIGLHVGPVTAGVIGTQRMQYDVWGDTVNVASRMESTGEPSRIHISSAFAQSLSSTPFSIVPRGEVEIKGKGKMTTYWLEGA